MHARPEDEPADALQSEFWTPQRLIGLKGNGSETTTARGRSRSTGSRRYSPGPGVQSSSPSAVCGRDV
jgi:hypothetical protein